MFGRIGWRRAGEVVGAGRRRGLHVDRCRRPGARLGRRAHRAQRPADAKRSFGYHRLRVLAKFVNGCALLFIVAWISFEAIERLLNPGARERARDLVDRHHWPRHQSHRVRHAPPRLLARRHERLGRGHLHVLGDFVAPAAAIVAALVIRGRAGCPSIRSSPCWCAH